MPAAPTRIFEKAVFSDDFLRRIISFIDHTALDDAKSAEAALTVAREAAQFRPAAVCIWPEHVRAVKALLLREGAASVPVATVVNFPAGTDEPATVADATHRALADGADEIDVVLPPADWRNGHASQTTAREVLRVCRAACEGHVLKVILETARLHDPAQIQAAAEAALAAGADFLKTSTGKHPHDGDLTAKLQAAGIMLDVLKVPPPAGARPRGLKVSGGLATIADAEKFLALAAAKMGAPWPTPATFRLGASKLLREIAQLLK